MMDWTQTLTIILSVLGCTAAVWYVVREDIKRHDVELKEMRQEFKNVRHEMKEEFHNVRQEMKEEFYSVRQEMKEEFHIVHQEMKKEFSKAHTLWADLLRQIYEIKLDQSHKNPKIS